MKIAVTDANIFISLIKANLLDGLFKIDHEIHTTDFVLNEMGADGIGHLQPFMDTGLLTIYAFSKEEMLDINALDLPPGLSFADRGLCFYLGLWSGPILISNDNLLRKTNIKSQIEVHGVLWVLDLFLEKQLYSAEKLALGLKKLTSGYHRLPQHECDLRLKIWNRNFDKKA